MTSALNRKEQLIVEVWAEMARESAGAAELEFIQQTLVERLGSQGRESPAAIARTLADEGVRLQHPEILEADVRWRERHAVGLFTSEELNFTNIEVAIAWVEKLATLPAPAELRAFVLQLKTELELVAKSMQIPLPDRLIALEVAHWLTVWLQNPPIFADWLVLRRQSPEFRARFSS
ncbi:MAG TPA: hypothetical protein VFO72_01845 [Pyrinomonadaceae bacterium]|nr:hypothetical protein [Pyrinomonadaceae bacterium]